MAILLLESKRDELLLPYLNIIRGKGIQKSLGQFKDDMLRKLSGQASLPNLSLGSNFYLAGAVRYYFAGNLTTDGKVAYAEQGDVNARDNWNVDVCVKLNALINILRNSYIDTIGEKFEQPEDFGTLPLDKLFKKYGKKIEKEVGQTAQNDDWRAQFSVGNGYTYDILYTFNDAKKYCHLTAPGSWCITREAKWFREYINDNDIHYVIFLKNGYRELNRANFPGPGYTKEKPHDEYGNSMIAMLQSNYSWRPVIITSRWNHGDSSDNTQGTEADAAYTLSEFMQITGVTEEDLKKIYEKWRSNDKTTKAATAKEAKEEKNNVIRKLKYAQILMNGGESPASAVSAIGGSVIKTMWGKKDVGSKSVILCSISNYTFFIDRCKVVFESLGEGYLPIMLNEKYSCENSSGVNNGILINCGNASMIYNIRYREMVTIDGVNKFKVIPDYSRTKDVTFIEVKQTKSLTALISGSDLRPLKLPNGRSWFMYLRCEDCTGETDRRTIETQIVSKQNSSVLEIWVSSRKSIYYNCITGKFFEAPEFTEELAREFNIGPEHIGSYRLLLNEHCSPKNFYSFFPYYFYNENKSVAGLYISGYASESMFFDKRGERIYVDGKGVFYDPSAMTDSIFSYRTTQSVRAGRYEYEVALYDTNLRRTIGINGTPLVFKNRFYVTVGHRGKYKMLYGIGNGFARNCAYIYDSEEGRILLNPTKWPTDIIFSDVEIYLDRDMLEGMSSVERACYGEVEETDFPFIKFKKDDFDKWEYEQELVRDNPSITWGERNNSADREYAKHTVFLPISELESVESNGEKTEEIEPNYAQQLSEEDVNTLVELIMNEVKKKLNGDIII